MAEFHLWKREVLEDFAEKITKHAQEQDDKITQLEADLRKMHEAWRQVVAELAALSFK